MIVNLTPHEVVIHHTGGESRFSPDGTVARVAVEMEPTGMVEGIPTFHATYGKVEGLPPMNLNTVFIVSAMVRSALPIRTDIFSPGELIRDAAGIVIGCQGLIGN